MSLWHCSVCPVPFAALAACHVEYCACLQTSWWGSSPRGWTWSGNSGASWPVVAGLQEALAAPLWTVPNPAQGQSLVLSTLFYGAGTWPRLHAKGLTPLNGCYLEMCRSLLCKHFKGDAFHLSDDRVLALVQAPCVGDLLHFHRLTYWASFVRFDVTEAWALVHQEKQWLLSVQESLSWLQAQAAGKAAHDHWSTSWSDWCATISDFCAVPCSVLCAQLLWRRAGNNVGACLRSASCVLAHCCRRMPTMMLRRHSSAGHAGADFARDSSGPFMPLKSMAA